MKRVQGDRLLFTIIPRNQHSISRKNISKNALKVLYRLNKYGFEAYLVGGGVRDLLLGKNPKDFDVTTNATPEQMRKIFKNCRLVGRRFRLAHVFFGKELIEVSTFRGHHQYSSIDISEIRDLSFTGKNGIIIRDNIFGSIEEDAQRRDFSVNCIYYSIVDFALRDYTGGFLDLKSKTIRLIGDPEIRYREDPVRMLRAVRFSAKLDMNISDDSASPIPRLSVLLQNIHPTRLFEESIKLLDSGFSEASYHLLREYKLFSRLFPLISRDFTETGNSYMENMILKILKNNDQSTSTISTRSNIELNTEFLFSVMLWYPLLGFLNKKLITNKNIHYIDAFSLAMDNIIYEQSKTLAIPKKITTRMRDIWKLQLRFSNNNYKKSKKIIEHPKFINAYELLAFRAEVENNTELHRLKKFWGKYQY